MALVPIVVSIVVRNKAIHSMAKRTFCLTPLIRISAVSKKTIVILYQFFTGFDLDTGSFLLVD